MNSPVTHFNLPASNCLHAAAIRLALFHCEWGKARHAEVCVYVRAWCVGLAVTPWVPIMVRVDGWARPQHLSLRVKEPLTDRFSQKDAGEAIFCCTSAAHFSSVVHILNQHFITSCTFSAFSWFMFHSYLPIRMCVGKSKDDRPLKCFISELQCLSPSCILYVMDCNLSRVCCCLFPGSCWDTIHQPSPHWPGITSNS